MKKPFLWSIRRWLVVRLLPRDCTVITTNEIRAVHDTARDLHEHVLKSGHLRNEAKRHVWKDIAYRTSDLRHAAVEVMTRAL